MISLEWSHVTVSRSFLPIFMTHYTILCFFQHFYGVTWNGKKARLCMILLVNINQFEGFVFFVIGKNWESNSI